MSRILVAEDDPKQAALIRMYLEREGHSLHVVSDGRSALDVCRAYRPDLAVLDIMLPVVDGLDVCRILRAESGIPILLLTARTTTEDLLLGLDIGADDYMTKPYNPRELAARVRVLLRRGKAAEPAVRIVAGDIELDVARFEARVAGRPVSLTAKEFDILCALASPPGHVLSRAQIIDRAFGFDRYVEERTVDAHIVNIRRKIEPDPVEPRYVLTVYGRGYRLAASS
ncbi:response regulator transcription factor [Allorhizocola rhizosphaerae]|uniref:response regulator transcription factor n=1 Tax=Allorhizocola rhizosphaerae TaxID=1872709 RepID=UPI000E3DE2A8|nr:response regulator transcription factor [Allorhizocola rhizosphaerae]